MTKDKILEVASYNFAKYGYDAVSMNQLVKELDINKATIYYHYKDKKDLYIAVVKKSIEIIDKKIQNIINKDFPPKEALIYYIKAQIEGVKEIPYLPALALREIANLGADVDESIIPLFEKDVNYLNSILNSLELNEEYKNITPYAFFSLLCGTIFTFYSIQMSDLEIGSKDNMKKNSNKSLNFISEFLSKLILDAICKK